MTRDECLCAISNAFDGVEVWAVVGSWNIHIETKPRRELILSEFFVKKNIDNDGLSKDEFTEIIKSMKGDWFKDKDGGLLMAYGFPSNISTDDIEKFQK